MHNAQFVLTEQCNLDCTYCYVDQKGPSLSREYFHKHYENLKEKLGDSEFGFDYFGGEALMNWELVKYITVFLEQDPKCVAKAIYTNGRLLTQERVDYLKEHGIAVFVSFDGLWEPTNRPQKGGGCPIESFKKVLPLVRQLTDYAICMVNPNLLNMVENYNFFLDEIGLIPDFKIVRDGGWTDEQVARFGVEMKGLCDRYADILRDKQQNCMPDIIWNYLYKLKNGMVDGYTTSDCGAGTTNICYFVDGEEYACERFASEGWKPAIPKYFDACRDCDLFKVCEKGCLHQNIKNDNKPLAQVCKLYHHIYGNIIQLNQNLRHDPMWQSIIVNLLENKEIRGGIHRGTY